MNRSISVDGNVFIFKHLSYRSQKCRKKFNLFTDVTWKSSQELFRKCTCIEDHIGIWSVGHSAEIPDLSYKLFPVLLSLLFGSGCLNAIMSSIP